MSAWTAGGYPKVLEKIAEKTINLGSDTITAHLTNAAPSTAHEWLSDITEIATGGGYTQGTGLAVTVASSAMDSTTYKLTLSGTIGFTATGSVATFQYVVLCFSGVASDPIFVYLNLGTGVTMSTDDVLEVDVNNVVIYSQAFA